jgi:iron complex outermembrane receptor protein
MAISKPRLATPARSTRARSQRPPASASATRSRPASQDVTGLRAVASPEWQVNLNPSYEYNFQKLRAFTSLHYLYTSDTQYGVNNNPDSIQKAYSTVDLTAGFGANDHRWTLTAYARNLTDERFATRISVANPTVNQTIPFQALQTYGVSLDVSF